MSKISAVLNTGQRALMNSQVALQTVGHNLSNKDTEEFSRQRVEIQSSPPTGGLGKLRMGTGAQAARVTRINNPYLERQLLNERSQLGFVDARASALGSAEQVFNEQLNKGLGQYLNDFFVAFRDFSNSPESNSSRSLVKEKGNFLSQDFNRINRQLKDIQTDLGHRVESLIFEVNQLSEQVASLNEKIQTVEISGVEANDERDKRDLALKRLGEKVNIRWSEGTNGMVTVTAGKSALIVSGYDHMKLDTAAVPRQDGRSGVSVHVFYRPTTKGTPVDITRQLTGGAVGAYLGVRDSEIQDYLLRTDTLAQSLANEINKVHRLGYDQHGKVGNDFFKPLEEVSDASERMSVHSEIQKDVGRLAASAQPNAPADNRIANVISKLEYRKLLNNNGATFSDFYSGIVGQVGVQAETSLRSVESQKSIVQQLSNIRESVSGVNLDEEAAKMIEFQKAFEASARLIRTADEMFDTVLSIRR